MALRINFVPLYELLLIGSVLITETGMTIDLRVISELLGNTSILVSFLTGVRVNLFLALHSYCPESLTNADLIINSDRRLHRHNENRKQNNSFTNEPKNINFVRRNANLKCTNWYLFRFLGMDRLSLNHVTFGGGWPRTLHTILSRLPSLIVALFTVSDSIEVRCPADRKMRKERKRNHLWTCEHWFRTQNTN